jgi:lipopolysaccharide export LptBFGC system permease protein LptF
MPSRSPGFAGGVTRPGAATSSPSGRVARRAAPPPRRRRRAPARGAPLTMSLYLASEVLQVFAVALLAVVLLYVTVVAFQLVRDGIRLSFVWPHLLRTIAYPLFFSIPLALLFAITLGLGRMGNDNELSALRAQGVSYLQLAAPVAVLAVLLGSLTFYLTGWVLPEVHYEQANLRETILDQLNHLGSGSNRSILLPGNVSLWVKRYEGTRLKGILLDIPEREELEALPELREAASEMVRRRLSGRGGKVTLVARESELEVAPDRSRVILWLHGVELLMPEEVATARGKDVFHQKFSIDKLPLPLSFARRGESAKDLANPELLRWIRSIRTRMASIREEMRRSSPTVPAAGGAAGGSDALRLELSYQTRRAVRAEVELHSRLTFSLACLTFPLVAFPLVMLLEARGRLTLFFLGNLSALALFFPLVMAGHLAAEHGFPAGLAMALPNLALGMAGGVLLRLMVLR